MQGLASFPDLPSQLLTYDQAADILQVDPRTIWNYVNRGELRATRLGRSVRFDPADLRDFIDRGRTAASAAVEVTAPDQAGGGQ